MNIASSFPPEFHASVRRLLMHADRDTGQSRRVADFLLAWWDSRENNGIDPADLWACDKEITEDMICVFAGIMRVPAYPDSIGYGGEFKALRQRWRGGSRPTIPAP
jgi:hypothetical protein